MALTRLRTGGIAANAVVAASIAPGAVDITDIADGAVTEAKLATNAVTEAKLATNAVVAAKIANNAVVSTKLSAGSVEQYFSDTGYNTQFRNRIINGDMRIDQRNAGASVTPSSLNYTLDRWQATLSVASKYAIVQSSTAPAGFNNSLLATSSSAYTVAAGDNFTIRQQIEGYNIADLGWGTANAKTVTLSFWVRSSLTGSFGGSIRNSAQNRSYPFSYTISVADTFEYKTVEIEGDTSGTWLTTNGLGMHVTFSLGAGANFNGTADVWAGANYIQPTGSTSLVGTSGATLYITGVQLEAGAVATPFERRPFGTELILCQRYFEKNEPGATNGVYAMGYSTANNAARYVLFFKTTKRAAPTISVSGNTHFFGQTGAASNVATATLGGGLAALNQTNLSATFAGASFTIGQGSQLVDNNSGNSAIFASAEL